MENKQESSKLGVMSLTFMVVAFTVTLVNFATSAQTTAYLSFGNGILAIVIAFIVLSLIWTFSGMIGYTSKKGAAEILRSVFGKKGAVVPSLMMCLAMEGFAIFDFWFFGSSLKNIFGSDAFFYIGVALGVACAIIGAIKNIGSYKWLTILTIPIALAIFIAILVSTINMSGGMEFVANYQPQETIPVMVAANAMIGSFVAVTTGFNDMTSCAKNKWAVLIAMPVGMLAIAFQFFVGQVGAIGLAIVDFTSLAACMIGPMFYFSNIFAIFAQANTVPGGTVIISNQFHTHFGIPFKAMVFIQPILASVGSILLFVGADISLASKFTTLLTCIFGPLLGVNICEFYVVGRLKLRDGEEMIRWSPAGLTSIAVGFFVGVLLNYVIENSLPTVLVCFAISFIVHIILRKGLKLK